RSIIIRSQNFPFAILICTLKDLVRAFADRLTAGTSPACVTRGYNNQLNTVKQRLVFKKITQLPKVPTSKFRSKLFVSTFRSKPNVRQVLNSNPLVVRFSRLNNFFCDPSNAPQGNH